MAVLRFIRRAFVFRSWSLAKWAFDYERAEK